MTTPFNTSELINDIDDKLLQELMTFTQQKIQEAIDETNVTNAHVECVLKSLSNR